MASFPFWDQTKVQKASSDNLFNTEAMLPISEIRDGVVILKDGGLRGIIRVEGLNLDLKNYDEQQVVLEQYKRFLNGLSFPIQILVRNTYLDLTDYLWYIRGNLGDIENSALKNQWETYLSFLEGIDAQQGLIYVKEFYVVVPFYADEQDNKQVNKSWPDTFLIATCVVTDRAKNKRLKEALKALKSWMKIAITGCGTLEKGKLISETEFFSIYPELLPYQGNIQLLGEAPTPQTTESSEILKKSSKILYTKHFLMIQNGCDNHCSFCLTVKKRGPHRSRPLDDIITEIQQIEAQGGKEIVLTGINLAARGCSNTKKPTETQFPELLEAILRKTTIPRIRISSIGPEYANDHFFEVVKDERILPHFHYSIQSFSDNVLQKMRRGYSAQQLKTILKKTRELHKNHLISIGADIIVGFPGESETDFLETLEGIKTYNITKLHAFPFSNHHKGETIPASLYPDQVPQEIKKEREARLLEVWEQVRNDFIAKNKGTTHEVLIEEKKDRKRKGRTENYLQVELEGNYKKGKIISYTLD